MNQAFPSKPHSSYHFFLGIYLGFALLLTGCFTAKMDPNYGGPPARPKELDTYYPRGGDYNGYTITPERDEPGFSVDRIVIQTYAGDITVDHFRQDKANDSLIFVFPLLGGRKNMIANYFADYFARQGYDTAIVHRHEDFKRPENFDGLEELMRLNIIRDRVAIDFFEKEFGKKDFGSFGVSRGGINVAMSAGVDERLKYNIIAMGGTELVKLFAHSDERRIRKYRRKVREDKKMSEAEFIENLEARLKSDPKQLAHYMDARDTLMFLSFFDTTVPIKYGRKLRKQIGNPETMYLAADHRTSILYTQFVPLFPPKRGWAILPFDYIESESLYFFDKKFGRSRYRVKPYLYRVLQLPFNLLYWTYTVLAE